MRAFRRIGECDRRPGNTLTRAKIRFKLPFSEPLRKKGTADGYHRLCKSGQRRTRLGRAAQETEGLRQGLQRAAFWRGCRQAGNTLLVAKIDRLARSASDLYRIVSELAEKGVSFKVVDDPSIDTASRMGTTVPEIMKRTGFSKASVYRTLGSLAILGF